MEGQEFREIPIDQIKPSKWNPRRTYDADQMKELQASIAQHGITSPLLVRPVPADNGTPGYWEIASGFRRFTAAKALKLERVPVVVREMSDSELLDILTIENLQREDVKPLEEANGYNRMVKAGASVAAVAERVSKSVRYVYDRLGLLNLTPAAQKLLDEGKIPVSHAVLLSRLKAADQKRALGTPEKGGGYVGGLYQLEGQRDMTGKSSLKPVSLAEFQRWIEDKVRFDQTSVDAFLFPETAEDLEKAKEKALKVVPITLDYIVPPEAKEEGERTYTQRSWHQADGKETVKPFEKGKTKKCDSSVLGVFVVGAHRGETMPVCVNRECATHFPKAKKSKTSKAEAAQKARESAQEEKYRKQNEQRRREQARWQAAAPAILEAFAAKVQKMPTTMQGELGQLLFPTEKRTKGTAEDLVRALALDRVADDLENWDAPQTFIKRYKSFGVDVKAILKATPIPKPEEKPEPEAEVDRPVETEGEVEDEQNDEE